MSKWSILQGEERQCYFCLSPYVEYHHIYFASLRKISDKHHFTVWLCHTHHTGSLDSVHRNRQMDLTLKQACQKKYEETHTREEFMRLIGRSYL